jgi:predicted regulator of Ras-like GTPase activity (Roadblock/LC7/MglB family)
MYRLNIRRRWYLGMALSAIATLGCIIYFPGQYPEQVITLPVFGFLALTFGELILCLLLAFGFYPNATKTTQFVPIAATLVGLCMLFGTIGNVVCSVTHLLPGSSLLMTGLVVSWVQLAIMNIGGVVAVLCLYQLEALQGEEAEAAAAQAGLDFSDRVRATPSDPSRALPAEGLALTGPPANFFLGAGEGGTATEAPAGSGASASNNNLPTQKQEGRITGSGPAVQPGASATRLDPQKRRPGTTSNKLQALSASKGGGMQEAPLMAEPGGLSSLLDRLDEQTNSKLPVVEAPAEAGAGAVEPAHAEAKPESATPASGRTADISSRLKGAATSQNRLPSVSPQDLLGAEAGKPVEAKSKSDETASKLPPSGVKVEAKITPMEGAKTDTGAGTAAAKALTSELDNIKGGKGPGGIGASIGKPSLAAPSRPGFISKFAGKGSAPGTELPKGEIAASAAEAPAAEVPAAEVPVAEVPAAEVPVAEAPEPEVSESTEDTSNLIFADGVDADVDSIFSSIAPEEAQREFDPALLTKEEPVEEETVAEAAVEEEAIAEPVVAEEAVAEDAVAEEEAPVMVAEAAVEEEPVDNLFGKRVDESVDDIFSTLAPEEAQRNFDPTLFHKAAPEAEEAADAVAEAAVEEEPVENLFGKRVDDSVDDIFSTLAPEEAQREVSASNYARTGAVEEPEEPVAEVVGEVAQEAPVEKEGLFAEHVDSEVDDLFSQLAPADAQRDVHARGQEVVAEEEVAQSFEPQEELQAAEVEQVEAAPEEPVYEEEVVTQEDFSPQALEEEYIEEEQEFEPEPSEATVINPVTKNREVKEFGRLSARSEPTTSQQVQPGTMKTIGKLLLDVGAIENIIKSGEIGTIGSGLTNARIITANRGEGIKALLGKIDAYEGVTGSLIVGHDGLVIASTVTGGMDKDALGALSTALLSTTNLATLKLDIGKLRQMVLLTERTNGSGQSPCTTVLTDVEVGILAVFLESQDLTRLDGLLDSIHQTIHG